MPSESKEAFEDSDAPPISQLSRSVIEAQQRALQSALENLVARGLVPGIGAVISVRGQRMEAFAGYSDIEQRVALSATSRFEITCLMKFLVSLLALKLADEGAINMDAPVGFYLEDLRAAAPEKSQRILVRHLLSHTSGYRGLDISEAAVRWGYNWKKLIGFMGQTDQSFPVGTVFNYEHSEHVILGEIIRRVSHRNTAEFVFDRLLSPCGVQPMPANVAQNNKQTRVAAYTFMNRHKAVCLPTNSPGQFWDASLSSSRVSIVDVGRVADALLSEELLGCASPALERLQSPEVTLPITFGGMATEQMPITFGLGCAHYQKGVIGHNFSSSGQACALRLLPSEGVSIVVGTNTWAPELRDSVAQWIIDSFIELDNKRRGTMHPSTKDFLGGCEQQDLPGRYVGSYLSEIEVYTEGDSTHAIFSRARTPSAVFSARFTENGQTELKCAKPLTFGFFASPSDGAPCLAVGLHTYKRIAQPN